MVKPDKFKLTLEKSVFFPGELVKGSLAVKTTSDIQCRGIRLALVGKGNCFFITGHGDKREQRTHQQIYASCKKTVWGNVYKTPVMSEAGENVVFGPPWAPDEGVMSIVLDESQSSVIVRIMDYDWGKKDDLLGEVQLDINDYIGRGESTVPLTRNGGKEKGEIRFIMTWEDSAPAGKKVLRLQVLTATGLRKADMFGQNDVYIQAYGVTSDMLVVSGKALPLAKETLTLPPSDMNISFSFQLPEDLPSTIFVGDRSYIMYSIYANIDIAFKLDVSTRIFFTVVQPNAVATMMRPLTARINKEMNAMFCCCPCFCSSGNIVANVSTDRTAYAPGEKVKITFSMDCLPPEASERITDVSVRLVQYVTMWAEGHQKTHARQFGAVIVVNKNNKEGAEFTMPSLPPSYGGGLGNNVTWFKKVSKFGGRWARQHRDPLTWRYMLEISVNISVPGFMACDSMHAVANLPVVVAGMGLKILPPFTDTAYWEAQEKSSAPVSSTPMDRTTTQNPLAAGMEGVEGAVVNWRSVPQILHAVPALQTCPIAPFDGDAGVVHDPQEDYGVDPSELAYKPTYYSSA